jgi:hypothetical protein
VTVDEKVTVDVLTGSASWTFEGIKIDYMPEVK